MKGFLSIASLLMAGLVFTLADDTEILPIPKACPRQDSSSANLFLSHETNCTLFYICRNGEKIERICPLLDKQGNRLHFNPLLQVCDLPENAKCESNIKSLLSKTIDKNSDQDEDEVTTAVWQNSKTCIGSCPESNSEDRVVLLQNKDCTKYCICNGGRATVNACPSGLHFNSHLQVCDWPESVKCKDSMKSLLSKTIDKNSDQDEDEVTTAVWQNSKTCIGSCPESNPEDRVVFLQSKDCTKYCLCDGGRATVNICPSGLHFNSHLQFCDWPESAKCENNEPPLSEAIDKTSDKDEDKTITGIWKNPETCVGSCPERDPEDLVVLLQNKICTKYCMCDGGRFTVKVCPPGLHFSLEKQVCTWPNDANCVEDENVDKGQTVEEGGFNDKDENEDEDKKMDKDEDKFYNSNSLEDTSVQTTTKSWQDTWTCYGSCPARDPEDHTILLQNVNCTKYCICSNGRPIVMSCPAGLHFSSKDQVCMWPVDAEYQ